MNEYLFPAYIVLAMFIAAMNARALGAMISFSIGLLMVYPDADKANFLVLFIIPVVLLANFRD